MGQWTPSSMFCANQAAMGLLPVLLTMLLALPLLAVAAALPPPPSAAKEEEKEGEEGKGPGMGGRASRSSKWRAVKDRSLLWLTTICREVMRGATSSK